MLARILECEDIIKEGSCLDSAQGPGQKVCNAFKKAPLRVDSGVFHLSCHKLKNSNVITVTFNYQS